MGYLTVSNTKTLKGEGDGYYTAVLHLAPADVADPGGKSVCPWASPGCIAACLNTAGRGVFNNIQESRKRKTREFFADRPAFMAQLVKDVEAHVRAAARKGMRAVVRLNATSDLSWESFNAGDGRSIIAMFPNVQFYDYTKSAARMRKFLDGKMPWNYHLTFSRSECNDAVAHALLRAGAVVAVVFAGTAPRSYWGAPVVNGDETDLRFLVPPGTVVALSTKGRAKRDTSGFVIRLTEQRVA